MADPNTAARGEATATDWAIVVTLVAAAAVAVMQLGKPAPALALIRDDLGIDLVTAGWVSSIINLFGALAGVVAGILADRRGHRRIVLLGLASLAVGAFVATVTTAAWLLLAARFLEGLGLMSMFVAGTPLVVAASAERDRGLVLGIWSAFFPLGLGLIIAASAGFLSTVGWRVFFGANTALCVATLIAFALIATPARVVEPPTSSSTGTRTALTSLGPWLLAAMFFIMSIATFAVQTWLPTFLLEELALSIETAALASAAFVFLFIPANILGSRASGTGRLQRWHVMAIGSAGIFAVPFGIFAEDLGELTRALIACLYPLSAGLIPGAVFGGIPVHTSSESEMGVVSGLITQGSFAGNLAGPPLLAFLIVQFSGWTNAVWMFPVLGVCCLAIALAIGRLESKNPRAR